MLGLSPRTAFTLKPLSLTLSLLLSGGAAWAQPAAGDLKLPDVVVTASGFEQEVKNAPASISVVTRQELETKQFRDLAEALQDVEGIDVRGGTGKTGGLNISIRGMPSSYTLILIDGRRQNVAGDVTPNGFGDALTSFMPPISAIERIEVIRGPMSTLYGSDAMGGVVNIITRKVARDWGGSVSVEAGVPQDRDYGATQKLNIYANGPIKQDVLGLAVRGSAFQRADSARALPMPMVANANQDAGARDPSPVESRQHNVGARLTLTPNKNHDIWLDVDSASTHYENKDCRLGRLDYTRCSTGAPNASAYGYRDYMRFDREQLAVGHTSRLGFGVLESSLTRSVTETFGRTLPSAALVGGNANPLAGTERKLKAINTVADTKLVLPLGASHVVTTGAQWWDTQIEDGLLPQKHRQTMWSVFAEDEWRLTETLAATFGGRYDNHDTFGGQFTPRAYLVWNSTDKWTVKGGVSQGYKAPTVNQLIDGVSGIGKQGAQLGIGNPGLKPEKSTSTELGLLYDDKRGLTGSATLFHNKIKDRITSGTAGGPGDCAVAWIPSCAVAAANPDPTTYSINADEATTWGLELNGGVPLAERWALNMNYTWTDTELMSGGLKGKLNNVAKHMANAKLNWLATEKLNLWLRGEYRGKSRRYEFTPVATSVTAWNEYLAIGNDLKAYSLFHLGGSYKVSKAVTVNANIYNLLDKRFDEYKAYLGAGGEQRWTSPYFSASGASVSGVTNLGRTFWLSANINF